MFLAYAIAVVAAVVLVLALVIANRPADFEVRRSVLIDAPASVVFDAVNATQSWEQWSPFSQAPGVDIKYSGPFAGVGSCSAWSGGKMGVGTSTIIASEPSKFVDVRLEIREPMRATNAVRFAFELEDGRTRVTWGMSGKNGFIAKAAAMFMDIDGMIGAHFENGLGQLKRLCEDRCQGVLP